VFSKCSSVIKLAAADCWKDTQSIAREPIT
jgi:hypothetical protein